MSIKMIIAKLPPILPEFFAPSGATRRWVLSRITTWQEQAGYWDDKILNVSSEYDQNGYTFRTAMYDGKEWGCKPFEMTTVENANGEYVGDERFANYLIEQGIVAEKADPSHSVCSIGFCDREQKWAGWSHRALCMFGIGDRIFEERYGTDNTPFVKHGSTVIETLEQAKQAAINFAAYVS